MIGLVSLQMSSSSEELTAMERRQIAHSVDWLGVVSASLSFDAGLFSACRRLCVLRLDFRY